MRHDGGASVVVAMDTERRMERLLRTTALLLSICACATGEIRCYCNNASCVRTGYMCKSAMSRCFSQLTYERDSTRSVHGCAESLPVRDRDLCEGSGNIAGAKTGEKVKWPILLCCKEEMCNYMDSLDINIYLTKSNGTKDSSWSRLGDERAEGVFLQGGSQPYVTNTSSNELWFKAAVIAVPIAGGFILVLLVVLAVRVLRNDNRRHRQLVQLRHHRSLTKAQLYVADHFYQNELLADTGSKPPGPRPAASRCPEREYLQATGAVHSTRTKSNASRNSIKNESSGGATYRDVHILLDYSRNGYEKILSASDGSNFDESYDSVIVWNDPDTVHNAASV